LTAMGDSYALWALVLHPGSLPGGEVVVALNSAMWLPPILLMGVYILLLFPDGHLPTPGWLPSLVPARATRGCLRCAPQNCWPRPTW